MKNLIQIYNSETLDTKIVSKFKIYGLLILIVLTFSSFGYFIGSFKNEEKHIKFPSAIFNHNVIYKSYSIICILIIGINRILR